MRALPALALATTLLMSGTVAGLAYTSGHAAASADPGFKVVCVPQRMAMDDPIVFPGQPGKSHMHTFFGARNVTAGVTVRKLLKAPTSACGANFGIDRSAYWVPTLYKRHKPIYATDQSVEMAVYYKRAGGSSGARVKQAFPRGLRMIAGDMMATTPQDNVWFKCAMTDDPGTQSDLGHAIPSCGRKQSLILEVQFPDCWDGKHLDSADHKSHMAFSRGPRATCPKGHPVKLPQMTVEVWYHGVHGPARIFRLASGGSYSMHADVMSAWNPRIFAGLVDECVNKDNDCTGLRMDQIDLSGVTRAQIRAQLRVYRRHPD